MEKEEVESVDFDVRNGDRSLKRVSTDALITILPTHLRDIVSHKKNHEYRRYRIPEGVKRLWFFETTSSEEIGLCAVTHIATISATERREPGQVPEIPFGIGNREFNEGKKESKYGHPVLDVFKLIDPVSQAELQHRWNYINIPRRWSYVPQEMFNEHWGSNKQDRAKKVQHLRAPPSATLPSPKDELPPINKDRTEIDALTLAAYKRVDRKVKPVPGVFPEDARVIRNIPKDPLLSLPPLTKCPPKFVPTTKLTAERLAEMKINADNFLWPEEEKLFAHIFTLNEKSLAFVESDRGTLREDYFSPYIIPTIPHVPWAQPNIPIPPGLRTAVIKLLQEKINAGVYEPSQASYRSKWFCVLKKNGNIRLVHDLQPLNQVTIRDAGLPPILDGFVEPFAGHQCYTVFDLFWGFDARKVAVQSRDLTSFLTPLGLLRITSLPMGFTNSPAEFQQCMVHILQEEIPDKANIFIDDLPIKGPKTQYLDQDGKPETLPENPGIRRFIYEHAEDVHRIMHRIKEAGATFSGKKTQVCRPEVVIVGQKCTPEGRLPEDSKVSKILEWPTLKTVRDVRGFLGLCGTVRIWIKDYSAIARPLTELVRANTEFIWDDRRQEAFDRLKQLVSSAPALRPINYESTNPVILSVDSSKIAVGFILSQIDDNGKRRPARYGSLPMNEREANYSQPKLELYGLFRALRHYRNFIIGVNTLNVEVDAKYIKGMLNDPDLQPNATINRWIQGILLFDFKLIHVPASRFKGPDGLSRREPNPEDFEEESDEWLDNISLFSNVSEPSPTPTPVLFSGTDQNSRLRQTARFLITLELPPFSNEQAKKRFLQRSTQFFIRDGHLYKRVKNKPPLRVILEESKRQSILKSAHDKLGHRGEHAVFFHVKDRFFWPHMFAQVRHHVKSCHECQIRSVQKVEAPLLVSTPATLFTRVHVDVMYMERADNYRYIVAARDDLSRASEGRALQECSAKELASFFWEQVLCRYGAVGSVVTDNGPEMRGAFEKLTQRYGIPHIKISPYNSKANGVVERGHFIIREAIVKACRGNIGKWPSKVHAAFFADRVTTSRSTGFSPFRLLYGTDPVLPFDLTEHTFLVDNFTANMSTVDLLALRTRQLEKLAVDVATAARRLAKARFKSKEQFEQRYEKRLKKDVYNAGDLVLVRNSAVEQELNRKTKPRYLGPYIIVKKTTGGSYIVSEPDGSVRIHKIAPFRLLPYVARESQDFLRLQSSELDEALEHNDNTYHTT